MRREDGQYRRGVGKASRVRVSVRPLCTAGTDHGVCCLHIAAQNGQEQEATLTSDRSKLMMTLTWPVTCSSCLGWRVYHSSAFHPCESLGLMSTRPRKVSSAPSVLSYTQTVTGEWSRVTSLYDGKEGEEDRRDGQGRQRRMVPLSVPALIAAHHRPSCFRRGAAHSRKSRRQANHARLTKRLRASRQD